MEIRLIQPKRLTSELFKPFGDVIEGGRPGYRWVNQNTGKSWDEIAKLGLDEKEGRPTLSVLRTFPRSPSFDRMERHIFGTQVFLPLTKGRSLVAVAPADPHRDPQARPDPDEVRVFLIESHQGINFAKGTWHCTLFALDEPMDYVLLSRIGPPPDDVELKSFNEDSSIVFEIELHSLTEA